jgi:hypothetical protein
MSICPHINDETALQPETPSFWVASLGRAIAAACGIIAQADWSGQAFAKQTGEP